MTSLFRTEATDSHRQRLLGDVVLAQPLSFHSLTLFLGCVVVAISIFISLGSYARKESVIGYLSPDKGIVKIHAPRIGVVGTLHVREGQYVQEGFPLVTLLGDRISGGGIAVDEEMLHAIDAQLNEVDIRGDLEVQRREAEAKRLAAELNGLKSERASIDGQIRTQRELLESLQKNYDRIRLVVDQGYISSDEYMAREENLLTNKQVLANLVQRRTINSNESRQGELALERIPLESDQRLSELASIRADIVQRKSELQVHRSINITAPIAGKVTAIRAISGASVDTQFPLLTILPEGGVLEAHLFVPTRAIGFIEVGQKVRLLYDAFDYRRFGVHVGTVSEISTSAFSPAESQSVIQVSEPTYRVTVRIGSQEVAAFGRKFSLQAGMLLRADIVLEERSLINWLLDPLFSLRGRT